jgi:hypothetical protein
MRCVLTFARLKVGNSIAAKMAMIAITTSSSINVKPFSREFPEFGFIIVKMFPLRGQA